MSVDVLLCLWWLHNFFMQNSAAEFVCWSSFIVVLLKAFPALQSCVCGGLYSIARTSSSFPLSFFFIMSWSARRFPLLLISLSGFAIGVEGSESVIRSNKCSISTSSDPCARFRWHSWLISPSSLNSWLNSVSFVSLFSIIRTGISREWLSLLRRAFSDRIGSNEFFRSWAWWELAKICWE